LTSSDSRTLVQASVLGSALPFFAICSLIPSSYRQGSGGGDGIGKPQLCARRRHVSEDVVADDLALEREADAA
jgi:hypothetical protein